MQENRLSRGTLAALIALAIVPRPAAAQDSAFFPLEPGMVWTYLDSSNRESQSSVLIDEGSILGVTTAARETYYNWPQIQSIVEFYTIANDGDVYLHGVIQYPQAVLSAFDPPILFLDLPLSVGKSWCTVAKRYADVDGTIPDGSLAVKLEVVGQESIVTPFGDFPAFAVAVTTPCLEHRSAEDPAGAAVQADDLLSSAPAVLAQFWVAEDVGIVRYVRPNFGSFHDVASFSDFGGVSVDSWSWGRIKHLFR